jgi:hypothetical protein
MDPLLFPRRLVWKVKRRDGRWPSYVVWGFWWSDYAADVVGMGDDPSDCVRMYDPEAETEEQARGIAKRYLSELGGPTRAIFPSTHCRHSFKASTGGRIAEGVSLSNYVPKNGWSPLRAGGSSWSH